VTLATRATSWFVDTNSETSASTRWRERRWRDFALRFPDLGEMSVLDLGGTVESWRHCPTRPASLTLLNMSEQEATADEEIIVGDACDLPSDLQGRHFDLVYSNSVIEHVGGHDRRVRFAEAVHGLGDRHWIQTPNRYFPIEPHVLCPGFQFLPLAIAARALVRWPIGNLAGMVPTHEVALRWVQETELLGLTQMTFYFPGSAIDRERFGPLTKSLIAHR
jgi:Methyltransferase domain